MTIRSAVGAPFVIAALFFGGAGACGRGEGGGGPGEGAGRSQGGAALEQAAADDPEALLALLNAIEGVEAKLLPQREPGIIEIAGTFDQPTDHDRPEGERFPQRFTLRHRSLTAPTLLQLSGYWLFPTKRVDDTELSLSLAGNRLFLEHRYYGASAPASLDHDFLTIEQSAADGHRFVAALRPLYEGRWISEGRSKHGMTALYHRRFYPDDVDATVAYVAPNSYGFDDPRYAFFLGQVGDDDCRERFTAAQREALERRSELIPLMVQSAAQFDDSFDVLGPDLAFEHAVVDSVFDVWLVGNGEACDFIPAPGAPAQELFSFFETYGVVGANFSDALLEALHPYYYQVGTQLGAYGASIGWRLHDLLEHPGTFKPSTYTPGVAQTFDPLSMPDIQLWAATRAERIMLIYGENDPWSAGAISLGRARDSYRFWVPGESHSGALLANMSGPPLDKALSVIERWSGVKPAPPSPAADRAPAAGDEPTPAARLLRRFEELPPPEGPRPASAQP